MIFTVLWRYNVFASAKVNSPSIIIANRLSRPKRCAGRVWEKCVHNHSAITVVLRAGMVVPIPGVEGRCELAVARDDLVEFAQPWNAPAPAVP